MASIVPLMRRFSRPDECPADEEIAGAFARTMQREFPPASLIERDRAEADSRRDKAEREIERLETTLIDLDTRYERRRAQLVADLEEARQAKSAAAIWSDALHPGAVLPAETSKD